MPNKYQNVNFQSISEFLEYLPPNELKIVERLRKLILECIPDCKEKISYNVPYYFRNSRICFIWPASVPWGNVKMNGVQLGFCNGNLLNDEINYLEKDKRKQVYTKSFIDVKEINIDLIRSYIFNAVMIDEQVYKRK
jgi:hypothetical protein